MANHKSAKKRARQTPVKTLRNKVKSSRARTFVKKLRTAISEGNKEEAQRLLPVVQSALSKTSLKGNTVARRTSRLASQVSKL